MQVELSYAEIEILITALKTMQDESYLDKDEESLLEKLNKIKKELDEQPIQNK